MLKSIFKSHINFKWIKLIVGVSEYVMCVLAGYIVYCALITLIYCKTLLVDITDDINIGPAYDFYYFYLFKTICFIFFVIFNPEIEFDPTSTRIFLLTIFMYPECYLTFKLIFIG